MRYRVCMLLMAALLMTAILLTACGEATKDDTSRDFATTIIVAGNADASLHPFVPESNIIFLPGKLNGRDSCWFVLDSGFPYSLVNEDRLDRDSVRFGAMRTEPMPGGPVQVHTVFDQTISLGDVTIAADSMRALPLGSLEPIVGRRIDGVIGHDLFERFVVGIDYDGHTVSLLEPDGFSYDGSGHVVDVSIEDGEAFIEAEVMDAEGNWKTAKLKLDTGSSDFIGFNGSYVQAQGLFSEDWPKIPALGAAVGGQTDNWVTRLYEFRLGAIHFSSPVVGYSVDTLRGGDAGTIGAEFFRRFRVTFDYAHNRLILEPNDHYAEEFVYDMSGIFVVAAGDDFTERKIASVRPGSVADKGGIMPGDIIARIEGYAGHKVSLSEIRERLTRKGRVTFLLRRGKSAKKAVLMLKPAI